MKYKKTIIIISLIFIMIMCIAVTRISKKTNSCQYYKWINDDKKLLKPYYKGIENDAMFACYEGDVWEYTYETIDGVSISYYADVDIPIWFLDTGEGSINDYDSKIEEYIKFNYTSGDIALLNIDGKEVEKQLKFLGVIKGVKIR